MRESDVVEHLVVEDEVVEKTSMLDEEVDFVRFFTVYSLDLAVMVEDLATFMASVIN